MYEDIVAAVSSAGDAAVRECRDGAALASDQVAAADRAATEASASLGARWTSRISAMRRRAAGRDRWEFGGEDEPEPPAAPARRPRHARSREDDEEDFSQRRWIGGR